jgi:hypothetical protein
MGFPYTPLDSRRAAVVVYVVLVMRLRKETKSERGRLVTSQYRIAASVRASTGIQEVFADYFLVESTAHRLGDEASVAANPPD